VNSAHVILSFNKPNLTSKCLKALIPFAQDRSEPIFLVHNGSRPEVVTKLGEDFPEIHHLILSENKGFSGGANFGLRAAFQTHSWLFFHTNDTQTIQLPNHLPEAPTLLAAPLIMRRGQDKIDSAGAFLDLKTLTPFHFRETESFSQLLKVSPSQHVTQVPYVPGTAFLIHRDILNQTYGFDESYHTYWEDIDLSYQLWLKNPHYLSSIFDWKLKHGVGKTCHKDPYYTRTLFSRNRELFRVKHLAN
jgi:GT2 family glycosyltransferase